MWVHPVKQLGALAIACGLLLGCDSHQMERDFFKKPLGTRIERLRQYPLADQYKVFRYGNDVIEPPLIDLAGPIADKGGEAIPFLMEQLKTTKEDLAVRDLVLIFETMSKSKTYDVRDDKTLMRNLASKISEMKDKGWQDSALRMLRRIQNSG